jgi:hypothetical protein
VERPAETGYTASNKEHIHFHHFPFYFFHRSILLLLSVGKTRQVLLPIGDRIHEAMALEPLKTNGFL